MVNPKRHTSCCVPTDPLAFRVGVNEDRRPYSRASLPATFRSSPMLTHPDLKRGEKEYIGSIARIYSAQQMIKLKQKQYNQLLALEMEKGLNEISFFNFKTYRGGGCCVDVVILLYSEFLYVLSHNYSF